VATADVYTRGHHDSVLRSHRWRTAENSAGYLLPHLSPGWHGGGWSASISRPRSSRTSALAEQAVAYGAATQRELADIAAAWREWAAEPHGVFVVVHGEVVARA
jgi:hypothetical protein